MPPGLRNFHSASAKRIFSSFELSGVQLGNGIEPQLERGGVGRRQMNADFF
jgi:hypothetical protein